MIFCIVHYFLKQPLENGMEVLCLWWNLSIDGLCYERSDPAEIVMLLENPSNFMSMCLFLWYVQFPFLGLFQFLILREREKWWFYA